MEPFYRISLLSLGILLFVTCAPDLSHGQTVMRQLFITTHLNPPFLMEADLALRGSGNDQYEGYSKDLANALAEKLGFRYSFRVRPKGYLYGLTFENGSWGGMIGELVNRNTDMVIADLTITKDRAEVVDFASPFMEAQLGILVRDPKAKPSAGPGTPVPADQGTDDEAEAEAYDDDDEIGDLVWLRPFTAWLWVVFVLVVVLLLFVIYFVEKFVSEKSRSPAQGPPPKEKILNKFSSRVFGTPSIKFKPT